MNRSLESLRERVSAMPIFSGLRPPAMAAIASLAEMVPTTAGRVIFREGDPSHEVFVVLEGRVSLATDVPGRGESAFLTLSAGELLGWSGLLGRRRVATARMIEAGVLLRISSSALLELCERDHHAGYEMMKQAFEAQADRLQDTRVQLLDLFGRKGA